MTNINTINKAFNYLTSNDYISHWLEDKLGWLCPNGISKDDCLDYQDLYNILLEDNKIELSEDATHKLIEKLSKHYYPNS